MKMKIRIPLCNEEVTDLKSYRKNADKQLGGISDLIKDIEVKKFPPLIG